MDRRLRGHGRVRRPCSLVGRSQDAPAHRSARHPRRAGRVRPAGARAPVLGDPGVAAHPARPARRAHPERPGGLGFRRHRRPAGARRRQGERAMKISTQLMYAGDPKDLIEQVVALENAGLDTVWVAEAYGFDSPTLMGYVAAKTSRVNTGRRGDKNVGMTAEIADGWLPTLFIPEKAADVWGAPLAAGKAKRSPELGDLDVVAGGLLAIGDDVLALRDASRPVIALYV